MEPPSPETSQASNPEGSAWWPASPSPSRPGGDMGASWDAATGPLPQENAVQAFVDDSWAPMTCHLLLEDICANTSLASAQLFLQKLWKVVNSQRFQSIWWGDDGNCIVIAKKLFRTEVLGR
uniref:HSF-type DNA-binding domain-containing protein n=1 Tax=Bubo bubo TaxID=30461 RepID=A0A8C0FWV2_BUBBB